MFSLLQSYNIAAVAKKNIQIDAELHRQAKTKASSEGKTLTEVAEAQMREYLDKSKVVVEPKP